MNVLFDFSAIRTGGGVQLAHNFLAYLARANYSAVHVLLPPSCEISTYSTQFQGRFLFSGASLVRRMKFEYFDLPAYLKQKEIDTVYTFFGCGVPHSRKVLSIVSVAYPIICYPDSKFWTYLSPVDRLLRRAKNFLRCRRLQLADVILAETDLMKSRLAAHAFLDESRIRVLPPSPSEYVRRKDYSRRFKKGEGFRILILGGLGAHKNIWRLNEVIDRLIAKGFIDFQFVISVSAKDYKASQRSSSLSGTVENYINFLGTVPVTEIDDLYQNCDLLLNISDLESFSNNYMEAWKAGVPLLCSDRDFAREICLGSAAYCEPHDPDNVASAIIRICNDGVMREKLTSEGKRLLECLPSFNDRFMTIIHIIEKARAGKIC